MDPWTVFEGQLNICWTNTIFKRMSSAFKIIKISVNCWFKFRDESPICFVIFSLQIDSCKVLSSKKNILESELNICFRRQIRRRRRWTWILEQSGLLHSSRWSWSRGSSSNPYTQVGISFNLYSQVGSIFILYTEVGSSSNLSTPVGSSANC